MLRVRQTLHAAIWAFRLLARKNYPVELDFIKQFLTPSDICFDVGAHSGIWSYPLSKIVSEVYAFEALPYYSKVLAATMKLLHAKNVTVVNRAVSDREGNINLVWRDGSGQTLTGFTHIEANNEPQAGRVSIATLTLDSLVSGGDFEGKRVAFIKCDVEGYECHVVDGARRLIERWRPVIFAEAKDEWFLRYGKTSKDLIEVMESFDYSSNVFGPSGSLQEVTATTYSGAGDILFRPAKPAAHA